MVVLHHLKKKQAAQAQLQTETELKKEFGPQFAKET